MKAVYSNTIEIKDYKPIYEDNGKWYVCFDYNEIMIEADPVLEHGKFVKSNSMTSTGMCNYSYICYTLKPSLAMIKNDLEEIINNNVKNKITNGFIWKNYNIYLSTENQMNYKANFELAVQTDGKNLPFRIKAEKNGKIEYLVFFGINELKDFYIAMTKHINNALEFGWQQKDAIDYSVYSI